MLADLSFVCYTYCQQWINFVLLAVTVAATD